MRTIDRLRAVALAAALALTAPLAAAQTGSDILRQASEALVEAGTLRAKLTIRGEGSDLLKSTMPVGEAALLLRREAGDEEADIAPGWTTRVTGSTTTGSAQDTEPVRLDIVTTADRFRWVDHGQKKVYESPPERAVTTRSAGYSAARSLILTELLTPTPFSAEMEAEELALLEPAEVNGVLCDIVQVTYPQQNARASRSMSHTVARIAIGREDHLPRRIERVSGSDAFIMTIVLELTELKPGAELTDTDFELPVPDGYELAETTTSRVINPSVRATARPAEGVATPAQVQSRPEETGELFPPSPEFRTVLASGDELSLETLRGSVGVLYFWGTWSMECRPYGPLVSQMNDDYTDKGVRVVGMAVRERDPDLAVTAARTHDYTFEVAPDATAIAEPFGVIVYPTFVVISAQGDLVGTVRIRHGDQPSELITQVRTLVDKAVAQNAPPPVDTTDEPVPDEPAPDDQP